MANINPLLKYVMKDKKEDIFHSSAYGKMQGASMGATSAQSFNKRREIDKNRQNIGGYTSSGIANNAIKNGPKAKSM